jgi:hypothetical protein
MVESSSDFWISTQGFWQINIMVQRNGKTGFEVPGGHYGINRLLQVLSNRPSIFQILMDVVLKNLKGTETWLFIDDIIFFLDSIEEHAKCLKHVLECFEKANLQQPPRKCVFPQTGIQ